VGGCWFQNIHGQNHRGKQLTEGFLIVECEDAEMPNISDALHSTLGSVQLDIAQQIASACAELDCSAYIVGGTVRDALLGLPAADLDVTVVSPPDDFMNRVAKILDAQVLMVSHFGTAKLELRGVSFDLVMARSERYQSPGALPDVSPGTLDDDLARRDFTINSMAASLDASTWGDLVDLHGGQRDLEHGLVRTLHRISFQDDATRILRAARYASRFDFRLADVTRTELDQSIGYLSSISTERFKHEMDRVLVEANISGAVKLLSKWEVLAPQGGEFGFDETAWDQLDRFYDFGSPQRRVAGWGLLSIGHTTLRSNEIANRWKLDTEASDVSVDALRLRDLLQVSNIEKLSPSGRVAALERFSIEAVGVNLMSMSEGAEKNALDDYLNNLRLILPALNGRDILALGVPQGPGVGEVLQMLKNARLDLEVHSRTDEIQMVRRFLSNM
jgi:tRNA nucleotidyltransferase (CCA-adding enzyme)